MESVSSIQTDKSKAVRSMSTQDAFDDFFRIPRVVLAPMAGITDMPFRQICVAHGAELTFTEMVSAKGLLYENARTHDMLALGEDERRVSVQLFGHEPDVLAREAAKVEDVLGQRLFSIDINMGCPARKIVTKGEGAALMRDPELAANIVRACKAAISTPLSVKFRRGYQVGQETCAEFARMMEDAGADALTVHGRFAEQLYRGSSDRGSIARVCAAVSIPVIGNGDVKNGEDAVTLIEETGCKAVMVARAAEGNPWIFAEIRHALAPLRGEVAREYIPPTLEERMAQATAHAKAACELPGGGDRMRRQAKR